MSSVYTCKNGYVRIDFIDHNNKKRTITLGKNISCTDAEDFRALIDRLVNSRKLGAYPRLNDLEQLKTIAYKYYEKLVSWDVVQARLFAPVPMLKDLCREFLEYQSCQNHSRRSNLNDQNAISRLLKNCDGSQLITLISVADAKKLKGILSRRYSAGTVNRDIKRFRTLFNYAIDSKYVTENPFSKVEAGQSVNRQRMSYVSPETILSILPENDSELRFIIILARFAGLRIPSEVFQMTKSDFSDPSFFRISKGKTGQRFIPQFDIIREEFCRHVETLKTDQEFLFPHYRSKSNTLLRKAFIRCIENHGCNQWERIWQNLRSSCISNWVACGISDKNIDKWAGNSEIVREIHYIQETPLSKQNEKDFVNLVNDRINSFKENQEVNTSSDSPIVVNTSVTLKAKFDNLVNRAKNIWQRLKEIPCIDREKFIEDMDQALTKVFRNVGLLKENNRC